MKAKIKVTLNRPVVVENKAGAAGRIAAEAVKAAPADGSTVWITASANVVAQPLAYSNLKYDPFKDFVPVSQLASFQMALAVPASSGVNSVGDYLANAKKNPSNAMYASPSAGSLLHFLGNVPSSDRIFSFVASAKQPNVNFFVFWISFLQNNG